MRSAIVLALTAALTLGAAAAAVPAGAKAGDVVKTGPCTGQSDWKLKLSPEDGRIEVQFEVDQNVSGDVWRVRMTHGGDVFFRGTRTTSGASGSFEIRRLVSDGAGRDTIVGRAVNLSTAEVCRGAASI